MHGPRRARPRLPITSTFIVAALTSAPLVASAAPAGASGRAAGRAGGTSTAKPPKPLTTIEEQAEDIIDRVPSGKWARVTKDVAVINASRKALEGRATADGLDQAVLDDFDAALSRLVAATKAKSAPKALQSANDVSRSTVELLGSYDLDEPIQVARLDVIGRQILLDAEAGSPADAADQVEMARARWDTIRGDVAGRSRRGRRAGRRDARGPRRGNQHGQRGRPAPRGSCHARDRGRPRRAVGQPMPAYRVVQWSTGGVGAHAIAAITRRPDLELVGVWVHDPAKAGRDAGDLAGIDSIGVLATTDADALLALAADCICYTASGESRPTEAVDDLCRFLAAGINVVTTSVPGLLYPAAFDAADVARLEAACARGRASLYASGIEPGFAGDHLVLTLATLSSRIRSVRTQEIFGYQHYPVAFTMFEVFGFGRAPEHRCLMELPGVQSSAWGPPVRMVAEHLGVTLDEIRETYDKQVTDRRLDVAAGTIEAGTVGAVRFETIGVVDGREAIVIEHVNRMAPDLAPDWPTAPRDGTYRIVVDGVPSVTCELQLGSADDFSDQGMIATTMRVVNAIPAVCDAAPGILTSTDLPLTLPRHAFDLGSDR